MTPYLFLQALAMGVKAKGQLFVLQMLAVCCVPAVGTALWMCDALLQTS